MCQWITILHHVHDHYADITPPDYDTIKLHIDIANKAIKNNAKSITSEADFMFEQQIGSDVAQTQSHEIGNCESYENTQESNQNHSEDAM